MPKYTGYISVPHSTYAEWETATNGNGFDVDGSFGCQCWDLVSLFWYNVGFPTGYPLITASSAYTMWTLRNQNVSYNGTTYFDIIYNLVDVKKGDVMVFNYTSQNPYGHVGFATRDYAGWSGGYEFPILSENNGGTPDPSGGAYTNIHGYDTRLFLGAFRYKAWHVIPPTPTFTHTRFPWFILTNKLNNKRNGNML